MRTRAEWERTRVAELEQERQDADDDGGAALDAARAALQHSQESLDEAIDRHATSTARTSRCKPSRMCSPTRWITATLPGRLKPMRTSSS